MLIAGTEIICQARGVPLPNITWTRANGERIGTIPGLRQVRLVSSFLASDRFVFSLILFGLRQIRLFPSTFWPQTGLFIQNVINLYK